MVKYKDDISDRQKLVLKCVVENYIRSKSPIGSVSLLQLPYFSKYSSATLRAEMQYLETLGYLEKAYSSSGRVPSQLGYKYYVENLLTRDQDVEKYFPLINNIIETNKLTIQLAIESITGLLSKILPYAVISIPYGSEELITKIDVVPTGVNMAVALIVTNFGKVYYHNFYISNTKNLLEINEVGKLLNSMVVDKTLLEAKEILTKKPESNDVSLFLKNQHQIVESFIQAFEKFSNDKVIVQGLSNVFLHEEFNDPNIIKSLYEVLDKKNIIKLLAERTDLSYKFGNDMEIYTFENHTIVSIPYQIGELEKAKLAVLGPISMNYQLIIPLLEYVSSKITNMNKEE